MNFAPENRIGYCKNPLGKYCIPIFTSLLSRVLHQDITHVTFLQGQV